jgi:hypothetical protein
VEASVQNIVGVPPLPAQVSSEDASAIAADVRCLIISARRLLAGGGSDPPVESDQLFRSAARRAGPAFGAGRSFTPLTRHADVAFAITPAL